MNPNENNIENNIQVDEFNIKKIIYLILRQWYWFVLFGILGLGAGFVYYKFSRPVYSISTSILVPERSSDLNVNELFKGGVDQGYNNIFNQIEIIKSYQTINQTLVNLNWRTSWYRKALLVWKGIYKYEPFDVVEHPNFVNPSGVEIHITPTSKDYYTVTVEGKNIQFEEEGTFNLPFVNDYFSFTLLKNGKPMKYTKNTILSLMI